MRVNRAIISSMLNGFRIVIVLFSVLASCLATYAQENSCEITISDSVFLIIERAEFNAKNHKISFDQNKNPYAIDGKPIFGTDLELPKYFLKSASLQIVSKAIDLEVDNMYNPWYGKCLSKKSVEFNSYGYEMRLSLLLSDGAGTYLAEWLIIEESSSRTILTKDDDLIISHFYKK